MSRIVVILVSILMVFVLGGGVAAALGMVGDPIAVWDADDRTYATDVVFNQEHGEYLILFTSYHTGSSDIYARRVATDGALLSWFVVAGGPTESVEGARAVYNPSREEYFIAWHKSQILGTGGDILVRTVSWDGASMSPIVGTVTDLDDQGRPDVAYNSVDDEYLVVYGNYWEEEKNDIAAQRLRTTDLTLLAWEAVASDSADDRENARVAYNVGENNYLIAYTRGQSAISGKIVPADLAGLSSAPEIEILGASGLQVSEMIGLAASVTEYLVTWDYSLLSGRTTRARRVTSAGVPQGPADGFLVFDGLQSFTRIGPTEVSHGSYDSFVLAWDAENNVADLYDVDGAVVRPGNDVTTSGPLIVAGGAAHQFSSRIACADTGQCLVVYSDEETQNDVNIRARFFRPIVFASGFESGDTSSWSSSNP